MIKSPPLVAVLVILLFLYGNETNAQTDTVTYHISISQKNVNIAGKESMGLTINGSIPGPTLRFPEGGYAVIYVKNEMNVETSVHWHGLLLPNFQDGVPYLTTPPIEPGKTLKYEFALRHAGTYWYHSHTGLQEQSGVYGSIVIEPKEKTLDYARDFVVVLSDWTYEKPKNVLKNLKRGLEIYDIQKGTSTPLGMVIARGALGAQLNFWRQRMEGADIADIYYPAFLTNGQPVQEYPEFTPGEKVRLRIINAAASSQFWLTFGGEEPLLVAADGLDVMPVQRNKTFIAVAETYDFIVTIPQNGKMEVRATVQDGSGQTSAFFGQGNTLSAPDVPRPDKVAMMQQMAGMKMKMGAPASKFNPGKEEPVEMMNKWGMQMEGEMGMGQMGGMNHGTADAGKMQKGRKDGMSVSKDSLATSKTSHDSMSHQGVNRQANKMGMEKAGEKIKTDSVSAGGMDHGMNNAPMRNSASSSGMPMAGKSQENSEQGMSGMGMFDEYNYDYLKSPEKTDFPTDKPVKEMVLNLTGNMVRYIWSLNGVPLNEADKIKINKGEVTRIILNNLTMMHHPMHLHGHFFRVINGNGEYSPLKHTVNVAPMQKVVIEFDANEYGDWFFHCHVLYHMDAGMARVFSYGTPRDERLERYPLSILTNKSNHFFTWGVVDAASHMTELNLVSSNIRNQFVLNAEYGWNKNLEAEFTYGRFLYDYLSVFGGVNVENEEENSLDEIQPTAIVGFRYLTPYLFNLDVRIDNKLRPQVSLAREVLVFPRTFLFGEFEYQADFGWVKDAQEGRVSSGAGYTREIVWRVGSEYLISKTFSLMANYDNRFGAGGGLTVRF
ncbi:multicopper oxidase domain-containing protein [Rufibacter sp. XAAS-G3-1]|uniref:multicopper oxidase domain-containing protein n=1 Tax=Rufibacter sp. XAAS-G3-1 TaxID=2729134 RepID=UPI0015E6D5CF|nr:multicopper oxidase domain-containing protein [Rufibacter sp. XAAS-G3-1]